MKRLAAVFLLAASLPAQPPRTTLVVVAGVGGEPRFTQQFRAMAQSMVRAAATRFALPDSQVWAFTEDSTFGRGRSTKAAVEGALTRLVASGREGDRLVIVLFGHGNAQADVTRFNLPGPDMTVDDFARLLKAYPGTLAFVNTGSASGEYVKALSGPRRIVVTATKSAREQNETYFPAFFVKALTESAGDADKDGRVSLLEAFTYARQEVERKFELANQLASEHPLLDDDGDGVGRGDASERAADGKLARSFFLEPLGGAAVANDPRAARLIEERRVLEARIDSLRAGRAAMSEAAYQKALEPLMVELAEKTRALRALEVRKP
jgi:hypothetical protein